MRGLRLAVASFVLAACTMVFVPSVAQAHDGWRHGRDRDDDDGRAQVRVIVRQNGGYFYSSGPERRPPGWDRGRKVGWGGCDLPPGQAKKYGCYGSGYRYDDDDGYRYHQRRPSTVIIFSVHH
jgi:hypothetical protein